MTEPEVTTSKIILFGFFVKSIPNLPAILNLISSMTSIKLAYSWVVFEVVVELKVYEKPTDVLD
jgi:hypothetical protein